MWSGIAIDGAWVAALAAVTLADSLQRAPAGSLVFRRYGLGPWQAVPAPEGRTFHVLSWWSPFTLTVVASPEPSLPPGAPRPYQQLERVRSLVTALRVIGAVALVTLVLGLPALAGFLGLPGFLAGFTALLLLAVASAVLCWIGLARLGLAGGRRLRKSAAVIWPFSTPLAAERLLNQALAGASSVTVSRLLLPQDAFEGCIRSRAYDMLQGGAPDAALLAELTREEAQRVVDGTPSDRTARTICRRCGATWRQEAGECPECRVPLTVLAPVP